MQARPTWLLPLALLCAGAFAAIFTRSQLGDYVLGPGDNNATPTIHALAGGRVADAFEVIPAMGLFSVLIRVPAALIAGSDLLLAHRLGSLICMVAVIALALALDRRAARDGRGTAYRIGVGLVLVAGPGVLAAFDGGHPEEFLGGALCAGAVLAALGGRTTLAAVLLGLAIGTKQWALLAVVPTLLAIGEPRLLDRQRILAGLLAAGIATVFVLPPILVNPSRYSEVSDNLTKTQRVYPESIWWPISTETQRPLELGSGERIVLETWRLPAGLDRGQTTMLAVLASLALVPLALRRGGLRDPLAALTALMALRVILDPMNLDYYIAPTLIALATWEVVRGPRTRLPLVSLVAAAATFAVWTRQGGDSPGFYFVVWALGTLPLLAVGVLGRRSAPAQPASGGSSRADASAT